MTADARLDALLKLAGAILVTEETLPVGPGVTAEEVGEVGPWYGFRIGDAPVWGWVHDAKALTDYVMERVAPRRILDALLVARADLDAEKAHVEQALDDLKRAEEQAAAAQAELAVEKARLDKAEALMRRGQLCTSVGGFFTWGHEGEGVRWTRPVLPTLRAALDACPEPVPPEGV